MKKMVALIGLVLFMTGFETMAQNRNLSSFERESIERELEEQIADAWNSPVTVRLNTTDSWSAGNNEMGVRGQATATDRRSRRRTEIWYEAVINQRRNALASLEWGNGRLPDDRYDDQDSYSGPPSGPLRSGRYEIQLVATQRMMDVGSGQLVQRAPNRTLSQQWDIVDRGDGFYLVRSADTGEVWTVQGRGESGTTVLLAREQRGSEAQLWEIRTGPDNGYYFITKRGRSLDSPSSARHEGGRMQIYSRNGEANQRFLLRQISTPDETRGGGRFRRSSGRRVADRAGRDDQPAGPGSMTWSGRVDDVVHLEIYGNFVRTNALSGKPVSRAKASFSSFLPEREVTVRVSKRRGRGEVELLEQPSRRNNYIVVIRITDSRGGADDYEIEVSWN